MCFAETMELSCLPVGGGAGSELLSIWGKPTGCTLKSPLSCAVWSMYLPLQRLAAGHWARGTLQQAYLEKNPLFQRLLRLPLLLVGIRPPS